MKTLLLVLAVSLIQSLPVSAQNSQLGDCTDRKQRLRERMLKFDQQGSNLSRDVDAYMPYRQCHEALDKAITCCFSPNSSGCQYQAPVLRQAQAAGLSGKADSQLAALEYGRDINEAYANSCRAARQKIGQPCRNGQVSQNSKIHKQAEEVLRDGRSIASNEMQDVELCYHDQGIKFQTEANGAAASLNNAR